MGKNLYKEWYEVGSKEEQEKKWVELANKYGPQEVYKFNYQGNDGKFHREVFVFNREEMDNAGDA